MPGRLKDTEQTKYNSWSFRVEVGRGANNPTSEKFTATKPLESVKEDDGGGQDPHRVVAPVKKKLNLTNFVVYSVERGMNPTLLQL
jgi:hypothetical protein